MVKKILVANRGEVAVRIIRACKEMGIQTVAVFSTADKNSLPVALADERICIGSEKSIDSYLNQENIMSAILSTNAEAVHTGYGFLSENPEFAKLCKEHKIIFIGPTHEVMEQMGDKDASRQLAKRIGVPIVEGTDILQDVSDAKDLAKNIGYPVLIKATAGGGGKGIRLVENEEQIEEAFNIASSEALNAFGNGDVFMEKYLQNVRHIEVQVLADNQGNVVCLGERDCSLQLNKQKVLEEAPSPSPNMNAILRNKLMNSAEKLIKEVGYTNAGTVEFLVTPDGNHYFIEMNTRLQVEHGITEEISDIDIVKWQIRIACEKSLNFKQEDVVLKGHSIECRINAKSTGQLEFFHAPGGSRVHFDTALTQDAIVVPFYDSMLGKLIVYGANRQEAIRKMDVALCELVIHGVETNIDDQLKLVRSKQFEKGEYHTLILPEILNDKGSDNSE